jgi:integrase
MKAGKEHQVPLSPRAVEIIRAQPHSGYVFPGLNERQALPNMAMLALLKRMDRTAITVHSIRSSFKDGAVSREHHAPSQAGHFFAWCLTLLND